MIKLENVGKIYSTDNNVAVGIRKINLELRLGEFVAITGESGSGKSTLLNIISGIDSYEEGEMYVCGEETSYFGIDDLENYRNKYVGFIFQNYNIIDSYTVLENVEAALIFSDVDKKERRKKAIELIERVGLKKQLNKKAAKLSGGEKQRVVIARALAKDPMIIAADEPTGNLDSKSSKEIIDLIHEISKDKLVLIVTHDFNEVSDYATRIIRVFDGEIKEDRVLKEVDKSDMPYLLEDEMKKKVKFKDTLFLANKDLFSSPKRFIFHSFVFFILTLIVALSIGLYRNVTKESGYSNIGWNSYMNKDQSRIVINKKDGTSFTESELNTLKNDPNVYKVIENDFIVDENKLGSVKTNENYDFYCTFFSMPKSFIKKGVIEAGREPENDNEIVIPVSLNDMKGTGFDEISDLIGKELSVWECNTENKYTIVGCYESTVLSSSYGYVTDSKYNEIVKMYKDVSGYYEKELLIVEDEIEYLYAFDQSVRPLSTLSDSQIGMFDNSVQNAKYKVRSVYGDIYSLNDLEVVQITDAEFNTIYLSTNNYENYLKALENCYQVSLFVDNNFKIDSYAKTLNKEGYNTVIPSELKGNGLNDAMNALTAGFIFVGIGAFLVETFFIVFVILLHSMIARRGDMEILRTIGASKKTVKTMFTFELLIQGIISFILVVILDIVLLFTARPNIVSSLKSVGIGSFTVIFIVIMAMMYLLSLLYSKIVFKNTVKKSLDKR